MSHLRSVQKGRSYITRCGNWSATGCWFKDTQLGGQLSHNSAHGHARWCMHHSCHQSLSQAVKTNDAMRRQSIIICFYNLDLNSRGFIYSKYHASGYVGLCPSVICWDEWMYACVNEQSCSKVPWAQHLACIAFRSICKQAYPLHTLHWLTIFSSHLDCQRYFTVNRCWLVVDKVVRCFSSFWRWGYAFLNTPH